MIFTLSLFLYYIILVSNWHSKFLFCLHYNHRESNKILYIHLLKNHKLGENICKLHIRMCKDSQFSFLPNPGTKPRSPALQVDSLRVEHRGNPRIVEWVGYPFSSRSSQARNWTRDSWIAGRFFTNWAIRKAFSHSIVSNSLQPHGLEHARLPCLSPTPGACPNSCQLNWWYHPTISSSQHLVKSLSKKMNRHFTEEC